MAGRQHRLMARCLKPGENVSREHDQRRPRQAPRPCAFRGRPRQAMRFHCEYEEESDAWTRARQGLDVVQTEMRCQCIAVELSPAPQLLCNPLEPRVAAVPAWVE